MARNCTISGAIRPQDALHLEAILDEMKEKTSVSKIINRAVQFVLLLGPKGLEHFMAMTDMELAELIETIWLQAEKK